MKNIYKWILYTFLVISIGWILLTLLVEREGPDRKWEIASISGHKSALVVYDPDLFYNLDEQVCRSFGKGLAEGGVTTTVATVKAASKIEIGAFDLFVFCSNTYNWRPDWAITDFIRHRAIGKGKQVVAITLGSGSTEASQKYFEKVISESGGSLIESRSLWLMRPNDEARMKESNVELADSVAYHWAIEVASRVRR